MQARKRHRRRGRRPDRGRRGGRTGVGRDGHRGRRARRLAVRRLAQRSSTPASLPRVQIVSYRSERGVRAGVLRDGHVVDAWDVLEPGGPHRSVRELLEHGVRRPARAPRRTATASRSRRSQLEPPVPDPDKIVCIGLNYRSHAAEAGHRPARRAHVLREVPQRPRAPWRGGDAAARQREGRLRGRGRVRDRAPLPATSPRPRRSTTSPATRC